MSNTISIDETVPLLGEYDVIVAGGGRPVRPGGIRWRLRAQSDILPPQAVNVQTP